MEISRSSMLSRFQWTNLNFHAPGATMPGLGSALNNLTVEKVRALNTVAYDPFTEFTPNYFYASGEI
jgi:hypothetical protein